MENETNVLKNLLDAYFDKEDMQRKIKSFLEESKGSKKWMLYSDYCLDDSKKSNDVVTFVLVPFISEEHYCEMQHTIARLQPTDIKHTKFINTDFLTYLKDQPVLFFTFILDKRKTLFGETHEKRVDSIKSAMAEMADGYEKWCETARNEELLAHYQKSAKQMRLKVRYMEEAKTPNIKLLSDVLLTAYLGAYVSYRVLESVDIEIFGWFSDRDNVISGEDNIIVPIFNYFLHNLWKGEKQYQLCTMTPDQNVELFYEEFNRMADIIAGTMADYNLQVNGISADKFDTVLTGFIADNPKVFTYRFFIDEGQYHLAQEIICSKKKTL